MARQGMPDIRELTFQNVIDTILKPAGVKVGGYPDEIFEDLTDDEKDKWICNICYLIVREARECDNRHLFCRTCVFAWSMTYGENSQKCPMCRNNQPHYQPNKDIDQQLEARPVKCNEAACSFNSPLKVFLMHSHGRQKYVNNRNDLESLRPARPPGARMIVFAGTGQTGERVTQLRDQLTQGRMMLHQMMLLLHLEMQLRQQALVTYSQARDPGTRIQRLDEVLALNEQLNEVGGILSSLLDIPVNRSGPSIISSSTNTPTRSIPGNEAMAVSSRAPPPSQSSLSRGPLSTIRFQSLRDEEDDDSSDDDTSSSSSDSTVVLSRTSRLAQRGNNPSRSIGTSTLSSGLGQSNNNPSNSSTRPQRRSDIRQQLYSNIESQDGDNGSTAISAYSRNSIANTRLLQRGTSRNETTGAVNSSITSSTRTSTNDTTHTSIQRLGDSTPSSQGSTGTGSTSLPPINAASNGVTPPRSSTNSTAANANRASLYPSPSESSSPVPADDESDSGQMPRGSDMHQRLMREMAPPTVRTFGSSQTGSTVASSGQQTSENGIAATQPHTQPPRASSIAPQVSTPGEPNSVARSQRIGQGMARPNSVARQRVPPLESSSRPTRSNEPSMADSTDAVIPRRPNEPSPRRSSVNTSRGTFAPQRRFRRDSTSLDTQDRAPATSRRAPLSQARETRSRDTNRAVGRRTSVSHDSTIDTNSSPDSSPRASNQTRQPGVSSTRNNTSRRGSQNAGRQNGSQTTPGVLPSTAGQLLRARRRSEIQSEIRKFQRSDPE